MLQQLSGGFVRMVSQTNLNFTCKVCQVCKFETAEELTNHEKDCDGLYREVFTCDVCRVAKFSTIEEAIEHENNCRVGFPSRVDVVPTTDEPAANMEASLSHSQELNQFEELTQEVEVFTCDVCRVAHFTTLEEAIEHENNCRVGCQPSGALVPNPGTDEPNNAATLSHSDDMEEVEVFTCDVCRVAHFMTIEEAIEHENNCRVGCPPSDGGILDKDEPADTAAIVRAAIMDTSLKSSQSEQQCSSQSHPKQCQGSTVYVVIPPGRIGITLKLDTELGGATVTSVQVNSTTNGKVDVGDRIISINEHRIVSSMDFTYNQYMSRKLEVFKASHQQEEVIAKTLKHSIFSLNCDKQNESLPSKASHQKGEVNPKTLKHSLFSLNCDKQEESSLPSTEQQEVNPKTLKHSLFSLNSGKQKESSLPSATQPSIVSPTDINKGSRPIVCSTRGKKVDKNKNLSLHLNPAEVPFDPLDENFDYSLERELAWIIEESFIILPRLMQHSMSQPFLLDFAWRHGSFELRFALRKTYPRAATDVMKKLKLDMTDDEIRKKYSRDDCIVVDAELLELDKQRTQLLRRDVHRVVFNLGFRRSPSIERELNAVLTTRIVNAIGGEQQHRQRRRRKRLIKDDFIVSSDEVNQSLRINEKTIEDVARVAATVPTELTNLEDEIAFLVEESLILLPRSMLVNPAGNVPQKITTSVMSVGLSTQHDDDINWEFVSTNASEQLKQFITNVGIKRRPLQRLIRYHEMEVRVAFEKRRVEICKLLVLNGYRREQTIANLPSHALLEQVGLSNVLKVRLRNRLRSSETSQHIASKQDLRAACNIRQNKKRRSNSKRNIALDFTAADPTRYSALNDTERELAFLREEFEMEYDHASFDWDYIEKRSSSKLRAIMTEKKVVPLSQFPSVAGVSKLLKLVRLNSDEIKLAFTQLRRDIKYALEMGFKRNLRRRHVLPDLPPAPPSRNKTAGKNIIDVEYPEHMPTNRTAGEPTALIQGMWKVDNDWDDSVANDLYFPSAIVSALHLLDHDPNNHNHGRLSESLGNDTSIDEIDEVLNEEYVSFPHDTDSDVMSLDKDEMELMTMT